MESYDSICIVWINISHQLKHCESTIVTINCYNGEIMHIYKFS